MIANTEFGVAIENVAFEIEIPVKAKKVRKVSQKPKRKLIIVDDFSDDEEVVVIPKKVVKVDIYFPDGVWETIKSYMPVFLTKYCFYNPNHVAKYSFPRVIITSNIGYCYTNSQNPNGVGSVYSESRWEYNEEAVQFQLCKNFYCESCLKRHMLDPKGNSRFGTTLVGYRGRVNYDRGFNSKDTEKEAKSAGQKAEWNANKKFAGKSVEWILDDLEKNYFQGFMDFMRQRRVKAEDDIMRQVQEHNRYYDDRATGKANKEAFMRELATMLSTGELTYIEFDNIVRNSIQHSCSSFVRDGYREKFMAYRNAWRSDDL
jgi:hypothetical protein